MTSRLFNGVLITRDPRARAGSSLIETIVLLSVSSTLLLIAVGWIHQSMHLAAVLRGHERHHQSLMRLSRQFRDDAHAARAIDGDRSEVDFEIDDMTIRYRIEDNVVRRSQMSESNETILAEETYQLRDQAVVTLVLDDSPRWVSLVVHRRPPGEPTPADDSMNAAPPSSPRDLAIHAAVGRWNRDASDRSGTSVEGEQP